MNADQQKTLAEFAEKFIAQQRDIEPEIAQAIEGKLWDLIEGSDEIPENEKGREAVLKSSEMVRAPA